MVWDPLNHSNYVSLRGAVSVTNGTFDWVTVLIWRRLLNAFLWKIKSRNTPLCTSWYCDGATLCSLLELNRSKVCEKHTHESFLKHLRHPLARFRSLSLTTVSNALPYACLWAFVIPSRHHESCEQISIWRFLDQSISNAYRQVANEAWCTNELCANSLHNGDAYKYPSMHHNQKSYFQGVDII